MNLSLLQGIAGSEPGAGHAKGAAQKADFASAAGAFRALVDVLANGAGSADGAASTDDSGRASSDDAFANLTDGNSPVDSSDAATDSTAASVHAAIVAAWTVAPSSSDDDAAANDGPHGRDEHAEAPRGADTPAKDESSVVAVVSAFVPDLPGPVAKAATAAGTSNGAANQRGGADEGALAGARTNTDVISDLTMALTDEQADATANRPSLAATESSEAFEAALDESKNDPVGLSAKDLAALTQARQSQTSNAAQTAAMTSSRPEGAAASGHAGSLADFVKAATASARSEVARTSVTPAVSAPHLVTFSSAASFSGLLSGLSNGAPASNASALPDATAAQIVQTLRLTAMGDGGEARITLEPTQFGHLTVSVRVEQGQVVARMEADSPVVREWLQSNQGQLRHQLAEQHLTLDRLDVREPGDAESAARERRGAGNGRAPEDDGRPRRRRAPESDERFEVVA